MTFEQADNLCARIITFMRGLGGPYPTMDTEYLQWCVLTALASGQYVIRIDRQGIRYFANWWWLDRASLDAYRSDDPHARVRPKSINCGPFFYVAEVVSRGEPGDSRQMIRRMRKVTEAAGASGVYWHQAHRAHRLCKWREQT